MIFLTFFYHICYAFYGISLSRDDLSLPDTKALYLKKNKIINKLRDLFTYPAKPRLTLFLYYEKLGWMSNYEKSLITIQNFPVKAIKLFSDIEIYCAVYCREEGWTSLSSKDRGVCGSGKNVLTSLSFRVNGKNAAIGYRVYTQSGWTNFCYDGENCGNGAIFAVQISLEHPSNR